jgi:hypothetical protein
MLQLDREFAASALDKDSNGCRLRMEWENTRATVDIASM